MYGPALFHLHGEWHYQCETEAAGVLKTEDFRWRKLCTSTEYLVIAHLDGQSLLGSTLHTHIHMHTPNPVCVCQVACSSDSSVKFIDLISAYYIQLSRQGHLGL